jgi:nitrilase
MLRIAVIQACSGPDPANNLVRLRPWLGQAREAACDLILLPENVLCHGSLTQAAREVRTERDWRELLGPVASEIGIPILWGGLPLRQRGGIFDTALLIGADGVRLARYDKRHLFRLAARRGKGIDESRLYTPGTRSPDFRLRGWRGRIGICFDIRFPAHFQARPQPDLLLCPAAFTQKTGQAHWETLLRARAIENQAYLVAANLHTPEGEDCPATYGHSLVVDPWGDILGQIGEGPGFLICELRKERLGEVRRKMPMDEAKIRNTKS